MERFLRTLPKAELHVHLEGTLEPATVLELAERNRVELAPDQRAATEHAAATGAPRCHDLASFLAAYTAGSATLRTAEDLAEVAAAYVGRAARDGAVHVEVSLDAQLHAHPELPVAEVVAATAAGLSHGGAAHGVSTGLVLCVVRDRPPWEAMATVEAALPVADQVVAVGLDGGEPGNPAAPFAPVLARARAEGLVTVAHAGEGGAADAVREALDLLGAARIDHGVAAVADPALLERLAREGTVLNVCPRSNVTLGVVPRLADHPLPQLLAAGVRATLGSDNPAYVGASLGEVYLEVAATFGLDHLAMRRLARTSIEAALVGPVRRAELLARLDGHPDPPEGGGAGDRGP